MQQSLCLIPHMKKNAKAFEAMAIELSAPTKLPRLFKLLWNLSNLAISRYLATPPEVGGGEGRREREREGRAVADLSGF